MRSKRSHFFKEIDRVVIRNVTSETGLQNKHNSYYALAIKDKVIKDERQSKKEQRNTKLSCTSHEGTSNNSTKNRTKNINDIYPQSPSQTRTYINHPHPLNHILQFFNFQDSPQEKVYSFLKFLKIQFSRFQIHWNIIKLLQNKRFQENT